MPRRNKDGTYTCREVIVKYGKPAKVMDRVSNSMIAADLFREIIEDHSRESFMAVYLSAKNAPLGWRTIAVGGVATCTVDAIPMLQGAMLVGASAIVVGHNHPSGETDPSPQDIALTGKIEEVCDAVGYRLLDHVIVSHSDKNKHSSIRDLGLWPKKSSADDKLDCHT